LVGLLIIIIIKELYGRQRDAVRNRKLLQGITLTSHTVRNYGLKLATVVTVNG